MPPARRAVATVKLNLDAGEANPGKVGQSLGGHGVNIMEFCRAYNDATATQRGRVLPAVVTVYDNRSFSFIVKTPPASRLLLEAAGVERGSSTPNTNGARAGTVTRGQLREIASMKLPDLNTDDLDAAERIIAGTARSMGITISG